MVSKLPENLRKYRKLAGLKQEELAQNLGKTRSVISNWEKGINRPDADTIAKICAILKVTPNELLGWDEEKDKEDEITVAAHIEGEQLSEEEQKEIEDFIRFVLSKRKKKQ